MEDISMVFQSSLERIVETEGNVDLVILENMIADSCSRFPQFTSTSRRIYLFCSQYHAENSIAELVGPLKTTAPFMSFNDHINLLHIRF